MSHHTSAADIGFDRRSDKRTRKPRPSEPFLEYQAVERYLRDRFYAIDEYFAAVKRDEDAMVIESSDEVRELLAVALREERGQ